MSWNQSVVTNAGVGLLNESLAGHTLTIESAVGGAGTLTEEELAAATDVADQKQTFALLGIEDIEGGKRVGIQITNNGVSESYILHQIGVQARLEYEEAPLTLLIILQDEHGVEIPTEAENPDWLFEIYAVISISNKAHITVQIDTSAIASITYVNHLMLQKADIDLSNLPSPQTALVNLGAGVRPNLLVNGGLRIWQRYPDGYTGFPNNIYITDRFKIQSSNGAIQTVLTKADAYGGIYNQSGPNCVIRYYLENAEEWNGRTMTLSRLRQLAGGNMELESVTKTAAEWSQSMDILGWFGYGWVSAGEKIFAYKLEEGEGQTLGYQDFAGAWHLLPQPDDDYRTQLAKCKYFFNRFPYVEGTLIGFGLAMSPTELNVLLKIPAMRVNPSISVSTFNDIGIGVASIATGIRPTGILGSYIDAEGVVNISFSFSGGLNQGEIYRIGLLRGYVDFDAEL